MENLVSSNKSNITESNDAKVNFSAPFVCQDGRKYQSVNQESRDVRIFACIQIVPDIGSIATIS